MSAIAFQESRLERYGGFGYPEHPGPVEVCPLDNGGTPLPTDLYCLRHDRFLPLINAGLPFRATFIIVLSGAVYACFELTARLDSLIPVYIIYALAGLEAVALPLRHYAGTFGAVILIWLAASVVPIGFRLTAIRAHPGIAAALAVTTTTVLTGYVIFELLLDYRGEGDTALRRSRTVAVALATGLIISAGSGLADLWLFLNSRLWPGYEARTAEILLFVALGALAASVLLAASAAFIHGVLAVDRQVPQLRPPKRPDLVHWDWRLPPRDPSVPGDVVDHIAGIFASAVYVSSDAALLAAAAASRVAVNAILLAVYRVRRFMVAVINVVIKVAILVARFLAAALQYAFRTGWRAFLAAVKACRFVLISVAVPAAALGGAGWLILAAAELTRRYLVTGSLIALAELGAFAVTAVAALAVAWIIAAGQRLSKSRASLERSASATLGYGLLLLAVGGILLGLPGTLGYGPIRLGWVTLGANAVLLLATAITRLRNRAGRTAPGS